MPVAAAPGANALAERGQPLTTANPRAKARIAAQSPARIVRAGHGLVVTHGRGPLVGLLALQGAVDGPDAAGSPDDSGAETGGMVAQEPQRALGENQTVAP